MKEVLNNLGMVLFLLSLVTIPVGLLAAIFTLIFGNKKSQRVALIIFLSGIVSLILSVSFCSMGGFSL